MPTCPACQSERTGYYFDAKTGRAVYQDAKALAKCHDCGDVFIAAGSVLEKRIGMSRWQRWSRFVAYFSGAALGLLEYWFDILWIGLSAKWALAAALVFTALGLAEILLARSLPSGGIHIVKTRSITLYVIILLIRYAIPIGLIAMIALFSIQRIQRVLDGIRPDLPM